MIKNMIKNMMKIWWKKMMNKFEKNASIALYFSFKKLQIWVQFVYFLLQIFDRLFIWCLMLLILIPKLMNLIFLLLYFMNFC